MKWMIASDLHGSAKYCRQMVEAVKAKGLWTPGAGKTPEQTLYSSIKREIASKGGTSRFIMSQVKGHFALRP